MKRWLLRPGADPESPKLHWRQGRWYQVGDYEMRILDTTPRGFIVEKRTTIDTILEECIE